MRVLIADDDRMSSAIVGAALSQWGYEVTTVSDGEAAWRELQTTSPPLAVLDWMMPGVDGIELCRRIRKDPATVHTHVILLTSREGGADRVAGLDAGADDYLVKPFDREELRARVQVGARVVGIQLQLAEQLKRITKLQEGLLLAHEALQHQASHDHLTGVWNRGMILQQLERELQRSSRDRSELSVILADIDHFKQVNDTYGHATGDAVLQQVATRLRSVVRDHEYVARYGGEEFLILLPRCTVSNAMDIAERARAAIAADPIVAGGQSVPVRVSLGVASTIDCGLDPAVLVAAADTALYDAKAGGRDRVACRSGAITA